MGILVKIGNGGMFADVCATGARRRVHARTATMPHDLR